MNGVSPAALTAGTYRPTAPEASAAGEPRLLADYWTLEEMAAQAGVSPRTLTRWHNLRMGPPRTRLGVKVLYHIATARAWLQAQQEDVVRRDRGGRAA